MPQHQKKPESPLVIAAADELMRPATRRQFVQMLSLGGVVMMTPAVFAGCATNPSLGMANQDGLKFDLRSDVGIFRLVHTLEQLEAAFYTAVVSNASFGTFFNAAERELFTDLRNVRSSTGNSCAPRSEVRRCRT